jgi:hypothetical protein
MDFSEPRRPCEQPPRLSIGATSGNVVPLHPERNSPASGRWRRAALIALGIAVLAATALLASGCSSGLASPREDAMPRAGESPAPFLADLDRIEARLLAGRASVVRWQAWKREPASLGGER